MRIAILGANGRTGLELTAQALARGHSVTAFVRSPGLLPAAESERFRIVRGDACDTAAVATAIAGSDAVLSALGVRSRAAEGVLAAAARSTVQAMERSGVGRLVVISMALLYPDVGMIGPMLRYFLKHHLRDSAAMEAIVSASAVDWTIVRPAYLTNGPAKHAYHLSSRTAPPKFSVTRADLAACMLDLVERATHEQETVGVSA